MYTFVQSLRSGKFLEELSKELRLLEITFGFIKAFKVKFHIYEKVFNVCNTFELNN